MVDLASAMLNQINLAKKRIRDFKFSFNNPRDTSHNSNTQVKIEEREERLKKDLRTPTFGGTERSSPKKYKTHYKEPIY